MTAYCFVIFFLNSFQNMECKIEDKTYYPGLAEQVREELSQNDKNRFVPMEERRDTSVLSVDVLRNLCHGKTYVIVNSNKAEASKLI